MLERIDYLLNESKWFKWLKGLNKVLLKQIKCDCRFKHRYPLGVHVKATKWMSIRRDQRLTSRIMNTCLLHWVMTIRSGPFQVMGVWISCVTLDLMRAFRLVSLRWYEGWCHAKWDKYSCIINLQSRTIQFPLQTAFIKIPKNYYWRNCISPGK